MKTTTYAITITVIAVSSMVGNAYFLNNARNAAVALDVCAQTENVYACSFVTQPVEAPRVVYKTANLLPPPSL